MHCRVDGTVAYDVLRNFEQRWRKATKLREVFGRAAKHWRDDSLLRLNRIPWILSPAKSDHGATANGDDALRVLPEDDPQCWHAQVFRSVDSGSVTGFPCYWDTEEMAEKHLLCDKNVAVDQSIHAAYVTAIHRPRPRSPVIFVLHIDGHTSCYKARISDNPSCKSYTYNFIGSSYAWPSYRHPGEMIHPSIHPSINFSNCSVTLIWFDSEHASAGNLVLMEIVLKVASKIRWGEEFTAYVVVPMWPSLMQIDPIIGSDSSSSSGSDLDVKVTVPNSL